MGFWLAVLLLLFPIYAWGAEADLHCQTAGPPAFQPCTTSNPLAVVSVPAANSGLAPVVSSTTEANHVIKASGGNLYGFEVTSGSASGYVLLFNAASAPADGAVTPVGCYVLPANSTLTVTWQPGPPLALSTGITLSFSSTGCFTKTASATAFFAGEAQ